MSSSLLRGPDQNDTVDVSPDAAPSQVSVLNSVNAETRDRIVSFLHWDDEVERDQRTDRTLAEEVRSETDFGLHTYPPEMRAEIVDSLHDEDARFPILPTPEEFAAARKENASKAVRHIQSTGRYRSARESA